MSEQDSISRDFKSVFSGKDGENVLAYLKKFCRADVRQSCFDPTNERQTSFNEGANSVYRHIMFQIEKELGKPEVTECITQTERIEP